jgi:nitrogen fixation/metabolism regulation signal transduction histidine kinase
VSLRARLRAYLLGTHALFAGVAVVVARRYPLWLFAIEAGFVLSLVIGWRLIQRVLRGVAIGSEAARFLESQELTVRVRETGDPNVDAMVSVYNRLVDSLREEKVRVQEQQHFLRHVIDASPTGIVIADLDGRIAAMNPAAERILAVESRAAVGQRLAALGAPVAEQVTRLPPGEALVVGLAGPRRVRAYHGTFMDRGFVRSFFVFEELTEELRQFERGAYERLIRVMSHEVNNTAAAATSLLHSTLVYTAQLPEPSRADAERAIGIVIARTEALSTFMRRFADVYRLPRPVRRPADLVDVVAPLVTLMQARADTHAVTWQWEGEPPIPVEIDRPQFEQAVLNILKNAADAAGQGGMVRVRVGTDRGRAILTVDDNGPGFEREVQENLFTPFFSTKPEGQGIGLTLVQEILRAHGCEFRLERLPDVALTRFTVVVR